MTHYNGKFIYCLYLELYKVALSRKKSIRLSVVTCAKIMILERALHFSTSQVFLERKKLATCRENAIISFIVFNLFDIVSERKILTIFVIPSSK